MHKILTISALIIFILSGCTHFPDEPWDDEYFIHDHSDGHHELKCTNEQAKKIARNAIGKELPKHYDSFINKGFSIYSPIYGDYKGNKSIQRYTYKSILGYKAIEHMKYGGSYYEEHIEVSITKECKVLGVDYFKGKIEYLY